MRWGVMLVSYQGMGDMNMWCDRNESGVSVYASKAEAYEARKGWETRNPKGFYDVREVPAEVPVVLITSL